MTDPTLDFLKEHKLLLTRENYLHIAHMGSKPPEGAEVEAEIPNEISQEPNTGLLLQGDDMYFLWAIGAADWRLWAGSMQFQRIIAAHGSDEEKQRLRVLRWQSVRVRLPCGVFKNALDIEE